MSTDKQAPHAALEATTHAHSESLMLRPVAALPPTFELRNAWKLAAEMVKTGFLPKAINTPGKAVAVWLKGRELGIGFMHAMAEIHIIEGKPGCSSTLMLALCYRDVPGFRAEFKKIEGDDPGWSGAFYRNGKRVIETQFTRSDAGKAGLTGKHNWQTWFDSMCRARVTAFGCRVAGPDAISGMHTADELGAETNEEGVPVAREIATEVEADNPFGEPSLAARQLIDDSEAATASTQDQAQAERLADEAFTPKDRNTAIDQAIAKVSPRAARADHDISDRPDSLEDPNFGLRNLARARFEDVMAAEVKAHRRSRFYLRDSADWKRDNGRQHLADLLGLMIGREVEPGDFNSLTAEEWDKAAHRLDEYGQQLAERGAQKAAEASALAPGSQGGAVDASHHGIPSEQHGRDAGKDAGTAAPGGAGASGPARPLSTEVPLPEDARMRIVAAIRRLYGFPNSGKGVRMALDKLGFIHKERTGVARAFLRADAIPYDLAEEMLAWLEARQTPSREELEGAGEPTA